MDDFNKKPDYILGLDLGSTSVGYALIEVKGKQNTPFKIIDMGVRIFPEGMDRTKGEKSLNQDRRLARQARRQTKRRSRRRSGIKQLLRENGLLPKGDDELSELFKLNPYQLRQEALDKKLTLFQLGRTLYHLTQRRGFQSNRKAFQDNEENGRVKKGISELDQAIETTNSRSLGEYLASCFGNERLRNRYTSRSMYRDEFDLIWNTQHQFSPECLPFNLKKQLEALVFEQRPLKSQKNRIGQCQLESDRKRAATATLVSQTFRIWQSINNLKILWPNGEIRNLAESERNLLADYLKTHKEISWSKIKKLLHLDKEPVEFNLEKSRKRGIIGNRTAAAISKVIGNKDWFSFTEIQQERLVTRLLEIESNKSLIKTLKKEFNFNHDRAVELSSIGLERGYMSHSSKALRRLIPVMKTTMADGTGPTMDKACAVIDYHVKKSGNIEELLPLPKDTANPMVNRALYQVRRVVNALIKKYGKPREIRIELARDIKMTAKQRSQYHKQVKERENINDKAHVFFKQHQELRVTRPTKNDIIKWKLWEECGHICPYTLTIINAESLFGDNPQYQIEHIIPWSRSLDDSYLNKTLCLITENDKKGQRTPYELYKDDPDHYQEVLTNLKKQKLPLAKIRRFKQEKVEGLETFVTQQLNETRYISVLAKNFLECLGVPIAATRGGTTWMLRKCYGIYDPEQRNHKKNRDDLRHHADDALAIALTTQCMIQKITKILQADEGKLLMPTYQDTLEPFPGFKKQHTQCREKILVSHKTTSKVHGALHKDFLYGYAESQLNPGQMVVIKREDVKSLKAKHIPYIRDKHLQSLASTYLEKHNTLEGLSLPSTSGKVVAIRHIRLEYNRDVRKIGKGKKQRYVWLRNNHHIHIYEDQKTKKWHHDVLTAYDAYTQIKNGLPLSDDKKGGVILHKGDMVRVTLEGITIFCRVIKMTQEGRLTLKVHTDGSKEPDPRFNNKVLSYYKRLKMEKVYVDVLGQVIDHEK